MTIDHENSDRYFRITLEMLKGHFDTERDRINKTYDADIRRNTVLYQASFAYLFGQLYALVTNVFEIRIGLILILTAIVYILFVELFRWKINRDYTKRLRELGNMRVRDLRELKNRYR